MVPWQDWSAAGVDLDFPRKLSFPFTFHSWMLGVAVSSLAESPCSSEIWNVSWSVLLADVGSCFLPFSQ